MVFHPFGNETELPPADWHSEPKFRGTFSILSTSVLTLFLCVWTAVHTNVPEHEEEQKRKQWGKFKRLTRPVLAPEKWRRIGWLVMGLLAPELVAWNAFEQRRKVKRTTKTVRSYIGDDWTDVHSWFAFMGGFAFDISNAPEPFFPGGRRRLAITHKGIQRIAQHWPHLLLQNPLSLSQILDKSKADSLTKFLTCWQATWFCVQCISRLSSGLAITLLELNVFGHAVCTLLIYFLWWDKPKDVQEPHVLSANETYEAAAVLCTFSPVGCLPGSTYKIYRNYSLLKTSSAGDLTVELSGPTVIPKKSLSSPMERWNFKIGDACWTVYPPGPAYLEPNPQYIEIDEFAFARLKYGTGKVELGFHTMVAPRCRNWCITLDDMELGLGFRKPLYYFTMIILFNAAYGGLHAVAFNALFPSATEKLLWRMSSLSVVSFGVAFFVAWLMMYAFDATPLSELSDTILPSLFAIGLITALLWYFFCRAFLVFECFISLAYLSESQLAIPAWSQYLPHLT